MMLRPFRHQFCRVLQRPLGGPLPRPAPRDAGRAATECTSRSLSVGVVNVAPKGHTSAALCTAATATGRRHFCAFSVHFVSSDGAETMTVPATDGQTILQAAQDNDIDIEGACGGECSCSTCHIILEQDGFDSLPEADEEELDMLDLAAHVTDRSRLGCQIKLKKGRDDGLRIHLPKGVTSLQ
mmetsp:Transcript_20144/g.56640  ORF Transcript_20144/g.56640 Transcript_20144/m.56640 type:complete len:183 (+) Transcript_20144:42-590(+)